MAPGWTKRGAQGRKSLHLTSQQQLGIERGTVCSTVTDRRETLALIEESEEAVRPVLATVERMDKVMSCCCMGTAVQRSREKSSRPSERRSHEHKES